MSGQTAETPAQLHAIVHGRVQGVNFRATTQQQARLLGLKGWVSNRIDGTVEVVAEGPKPNLGRFLEFLHNGPRAASVTHVESTWQDYTGDFDRFQVRY